jgi:hypothetical protein
MYTWRAEYLQSIPLLASPPLLSFSDSFTFQLTKDAMQAAVIDDSSAVFKTNWVHPSKEP